MAATAYAVPVFDPGGVASVKTVNRVDITQSVGMHDMAVITLRGEDMASPDLRPGTPVQIEYGWNPIQLDYFYGYIDHIETSYEKATVDSMHFDPVVCLGASYALKNPYVGAWSNIQASTLVRQVAANWFLTSLVEISDYTWPQLSSPGCSAWQFLMSLADKTGFILACNKTNIRFFSVAQSLQQNISSMPIFYSRTSAPDLPYQSINDFNAVQGDAFPMDGRIKATRIAAGIDNRTGKVVTAQNDGVAALTSTRLALQATYPFFQRYQTDQVVNDQQQAQAVLAGLTEKNRFTYWANATLAGDASVIQGVPIVLSGLNDKDNGIWWVEEVTHKIDYVGYSMDVRLGRDSSMDAGVFPTTTPYARLSTLPKTVLMNGTWRAAHQAAYSVTAPT